MRGKRVVSARWGLLLLLAGVLTVGSCADIDKVRDEYCLRHPSICGVGGLADAGSPGAEPPGTGLPDTDTGTDTGGEGVVGTATQIASRGQHTLVLRGNGTVWAWGQNDLGQLGDGTLQERREPRQVIGLSGMEHVAAGYTHSLALRGGRVWAWGQTGSGTTQTVPREVSGLKDITAISAGYSHSLALRQTGVVFFWGNDQAGRVSASPIELPLPSGIKAIAAGNAHSLALDADGRVWALGDNSMGQLGVDGVASSATAIAVPGLPRIRAIAAGAFHSLALDTNDQVWTWGNNSMGQLGDGTQGGHRALPQQVPGLTRVQEVAGGFAHSLALNSDHDIMAWGSDDDGQLGDGFPQRERPGPEKTDTLTNALHISAGHAHSLALESNGIPFAWGANSHGQLGYSTSGQDLPTPLPVLLP